MSLPPSSLGNMNEKRREQMVMMVDYFITSVNSQAIRFQMQSKFMALEKL